MKMGSRFPWPLGPNGTEKIVFRGALNEVKALYLSFPHIFFYFYSFQKIERLRKYAGSQNTYNKAAYQVLYFFHIGFI